MIKYPPINFWDHFNNTVGAMSTAEAIFMYNACLEVPNEGVWVEMGCHKAKSTLVSLMAWCKRDFHEFYLLEPEFNNTEFIVSVNNSVSKFRKEFGSETLCLKRAEYSTDFLPKHERYGYIMWDTGSHSHELVSQEKPLLEDKIIKDGILVMHDINSQFIACTEAYNDLINSGKYEPLLFDWKEIFYYVKENNLEEGNQSWHLYPELPHPPNFIGALKRK